jgi:predicted ATPase
MQLFIQRACAVEASFVLTAANVEPVSQFCRRLNGLPLAIELASARTIVLGPAELAAGLDNAFQLLRGSSRTAPARQQTLRATLEWSYALLASDERELFDALSVFAGGFMLDGAEALGAGTTLEVLSRLVAKSMVQPEAHDDGTMRYRLLVPLRQVGALAPRRPPPTGSDTGNTCCAFCFPGRTAWTRIAWPEPTPGLEALGCRGGQHARGPCLGH